MIRDLSASKAALYTLSSFAEFIIIDPTLDFDSLSDQTSTSDYWSPTSDLWLPTAVVYFVSLQWKKFLSGIFGHFFIHRKDAEDAENIFFLFSLRRRK